MNRTQKQELVSSLRDRLSKANLVVVTRPVGLTVTESTNLRREMVSGGAQFKIVKNTLARLAIKGTPIEGLTPHLKGPMALAFSEDPIAAAKISVEFSEKNEKLTVVAAAMGEKIIDASGVKALAKLPSLDQLRGQLLGILVAPATKIARVAQAPAGQLARVFKAYSEK